MINDEKPRVPPLTEWYTQGLAIDYDKNEPNEYIPELPRKKPKRLKKQPKIKRPRGRPKSTKPPKPEPPTPTEVLVYRLLLRGFIKSGQEVYYKVCDDGTDILIQFMGKGWITKTTGVLNKPDTRVTEKYHVGDFLGKEPKALIE